MYFSSQTLKPDYRPENTLLSNTEWSGCAHFHLPYTGIYAASIAMHATSLHSLEGMLRPKFPLAPKHYRAGAWTCRMYRFLSLRCDRESNPGTFAVARYSTSPDRLDGHHVSH